MGACAGKVDAAPAPDVDPDRYTKPRAVYDALAGGDVRLVSVV